MPQLTLGKKELAALQARLEGLLSQVPTVTTTPEADRLSLTIDRGVNEIYEFVGRTLIPAARAAGAPYESPAEKKLRKALSALLSKSHLPVALPDPEYGITPEGAWARFRGLRGSWLAEVSVVSVLFWKALASYLRTVGGAVNYQSAENYQMQIEGVPVRLMGRGHDPSSPETRRHLEVLRASLKILKTNVSRLAPRLVSHLLPVRYIAGESHRWLSGEYDSQGYINVYAPSAFYKPEDLAHTLAHENGHHLYRGYLSGEARSFWKGAVAGDLGELDLSEVLREWPPGVDEFAFLRSLEESRPVFWLQLRTVMFPAKGEAAFINREEVEAMVARGKRFLPVPRNPITTYASYSPEEAFCEAWGRWVSRGPRAIPEAVRGWLRTVLPEVRTAGTREAGRKLTFWHVSPEANTVRFLGRYSPKFGQKGLFVAPRFRDIKNDWSEYVGWRKGGEPYSQLTVYELEVPEEVAQEARAEHDSRAQRAREESGGGGNYVGAWGWGSELFIPEEFLPSVRIVGRKTYPYSYFRKRTRGPSEDRSSLEEAARTAARSNPAARLWLTMREELSRLALAVGSGAGVGDDPELVGVQASLVSLFAASRDYLHWAPVVQLAPESRDRYRALDREWQRLRAQLSFPSAARVARLWNERRP